MIMEEVSVCFISDTHNQHNFKPRPADVLIHAGDATMYGYPDEVAEFLMWFRAQPHKHKAWLPGNHDLAMEVDGFSKAMQMLVPEVTILESGINLVGPLEVAALTCMNLHGYAFHSSNEQITSQVNALLAARGSPELLVTHSPPFEVLDFVPARERYPGSVRQARNAGFAQYAGLAKRLGAQTHAFGHIHEQGGREMWLDGVQHINAAVLERDYQSVAHIGMVTTVKVGGDK